MASGLRNLCRGFATAAALGFLTGLGLVALAAPAAAAPGDNQHRPDEVLHGFTAEGLLELLGEAGINGKAEMTPEGVPLITATLNDGQARARFFLLLTVCRTAGKDSCLGMEIFALFKREGTGISLAAVNAFNLETSFASAVRADPSTALLTRYVTADHGIARGNVFANILNFLVVAAEFERHLDRPMAALEGDGTGQLAAFGDGAPEDATGATPARPASAQLPAAGGLTFAVPAVELLANGRLKDDAVNPVGGGAWPTGE